MKKILSLVLAMVMVLGLLPATSFATGAEEDVVYLSITYEGEYIPNVQGGTIMNIPVALSDIAAVNLDDYGLDNMWYDKADPDGDGNYEPTALQLIIYAHENFYGGSWDEVSFDAMPGSSYFQNGVFGFTQNLIYFLNGKFPIDRDMTDNQTSTSLENVGATSDHIILRPGDRIDMTSFSCWSFYLDDAGGFDVFVDDAGEFVYEFAATVDEELPLNMKQSFCDLMTGKIWDAVLADIEIFYGEEYGNADGSVYTDEEGRSAVTFNEPGTYYIWTESRRGVTESAHSWCTEPMMSGEACYVSTPVVAKVTVGNGNTTNPEPQDVSAVLDATMAQLAATITEPTFGTLAGEWTVFSLARGGYFSANNSYFSSYYDRIVEIVNTKAAEQNNDGALDNISTENSRLIVALSAIGKNASSVGNWNLIAPYNANNMSWIGRQGINGVIWSLIALDSNHYETVPADLRQTLVDNLLSLQHDDGGWSMYPQKDVDSNVDITGMTLVALYPYRNQTAVAAACEKALEWISGAQQPDGGFAYDETASGTVESCAWAIVAATTWGINPDTDPRFVKNGNSAVDNLLSYYVEDKALFEHTKGDGGNAMGTDQACYALVAYDRFINGETALFDYSDVTIASPAPSAPDEPAEPSEPNEEPDTSAILGLPSEINPGTSFNGTVSVSNWDNEAGYKLLDFIIAVPAGITVESLSATNLTGGEVRWNQDSEGNLRVVYFDAKENKDVTVTGDTDLTELFTIAFTAGNFAPGTKLEFAISGMSLKKNSDSSDDTAMDIVDTETEEAKDTVTVVQGISYSALCLYEGDGIDLIPAGKKAVAVAVTGITGAPSLTYNDGATTVAFKYSAEISAKSGVATYLALVDKEMAMEGFVNEKNYTRGNQAETITFGDTNGDGVINAQDALNVVDAWLRKGDAPTEDLILVMNVNGDSRINTFDALAIVENFVNESIFSVVTKATLIKSGN